MTRSRNALNILNLYSDGSVNELNIYLNNLINGLNFYSFNLGSVGYITLFIMAFMNSDVFITIQYLMI